MCVVKNPQRISGEVKLNGVIRAVVHDDTRGLPECRYRWNLPSRQLLPNSAKRLLNECQRTSREVKVYTQQTAHSDHGCRKDGLRCLALGDDDGVGHEGFSVSSFLSLKELSLGVLNGLPHFVGRNFKGGR
jgi:hypothetical protein